MRMSLHRYRTLKEHFPVGFINRVRAAVYQYANHYRLAANNGINYKPGGKADYGQQTCPFGYGANPDLTKPPITGPNGEAMPYSPPLEFPTEVYDEATAPIGELILEPNEA